MLSKISWSQFWLVIIVLVALYYIVVCIRYRGNILSFLKKPSEKQPLKGGSKNQSKVDAGTVEELEMVVQDLKYAVLERLGKTVTKQELLGWLRLRLEKYEGLSKPAFRTAINNFIITNAEEICGVVFSESELNHGWDTLPR